MPAPALPIPWDDPRRSTGTTQERTGDARTITGSSRTTTVSPRE